MAAAAVAVADLAMAAVEGDAVAETAAARELVAAVGPTSKKLKKTFSGTITRCESSWVAGMGRYEGFIAPDDPDSLPEHVNASLAMPGAISSPSRGFYVVGTHSGPWKDFVFGEGVAVTFQVKFDASALGVVACDIAPA